MQKFCLSFLRRLRVKPYKELKFQALLSREGDGHPVPPIEDFPRPCATCTGQYSNLLLEDIFQQNPLTPPGLSTPRILVHVRVRVNMLAARRHVVTQCTKGGAKVRGLLSKSSSLAKALDFALHTQVTFVVQ